MIDPFTFVQTHSSLEIRPSAQTHTMLEKTSSTRKRQNGLYCAAAERLKRQRRVANKPCGMTRSAFCILSALAALRKPGTITPLAEDPAQRASQVWCRSSRVSKHFTKPL
jgi:hypothetical protein